MRQRRQPMRWVFSDIPPGFAAGREGCLHVVQNCHNDYYRSVLSVDRKKCSLSFLLYSYIFHSP